MRPAVCTRVCAPQQPGQSRQRADSWWTVSGLGLFPPSAKLRLSLVAQAVKNPPAMQETQVQSLDQEDPGRRQWQPTPVFLSGESLGHRSLVGYSPWGRKELDRTEQLTDML